MRAESHISGISQGIVKEMAGSSHTPACCVSKLRSSLEAGKKQLRVWLQYVCGVTEMFLDEPSGRAERLYPSFRVGFNPTSLTLGRANVFVLHSLNRKVPLAFLLSPYGDSEMARNRFEDGSKWCATGNACSSVNEADFVASRTCVRRAKPCSFSGLGVYKMPNEDSFHDKLKELYLKHIPEFSFRSLMQSLTS